MLIQGFEWEGYLFVIRLFNVDGSHLSVKLPASEALDLLHELKNEEARIVELVRAENRRRGKDNGENE